MSLFAVQQLIFDLKHDKKQVAALSADPESVLRKYDLSEDERAALIKADLGKLYLMGVHPLLLAPYSRMAGVSREAYQQALSVLKGTRPFRSVYELSSELEAK